MVEPLDELAKVSVPALVLQGTSDIVIAPSEFHRAKKMLDRKNNFSFHLLDNVDHFMSDQKDPKTSLQAMMELKKTRVFAPLSPKLSGVILDWLNRVK